MDHAERRSVRDFWDNVLANDAIGAPNSDSARLPGQLNTVAR